MLVQFDATAISALTAALNVKQPAFGVAGTASADILSVQGYAGATPIIVGGALAQAAAYSGNPIIGGAVYNSTPATLTTGQVATLQTGSLQSLKVQLQVADSTNALATAADNADAAAASATGNKLSVIARTTRFNGSSWDRDTKPNAAARLLSAAASTNATSVKASAGNLHNIKGRNAAAAIKYLKLYNKASAPTVGTDVPVMTYELAASAAFEIEFGGHYFSTGIAYAITGAQADNDTTALSAGDILSLNVRYA